MLIQSFFGRLRALLAVLTLRATVVRAWSNTWRRVNLQACSPWRTAAQAQSYQRCRQGRGAKTWDANCVWPWHHSKGPVWVSICVQHSQAVYRMWGSHVWEWNGREKARASQSVEQPYVLESSVYSDHCNLHAVFMFLSLSPWCTDPGLLSGANQPKHRGSFVNWDCTLRIATHYSKY